MNLNISIKSKDSLEQMSYYCDIFDTKIKMRVPFNEKMINDQNREYIKEDLSLTTMHAELLIEDQIFNFSDFTSEPKFGNNISINLTFDASNDVEVTKAHKYFDRLISESNVIVNFEKQFWGEEFGMLIDKYNISWQFNIR